MRALLLIEFRDQNYFHAAGLRGGQSTFLALLGLDGFSSEVICMSLRHLLGWSAVGPTQARKWGALFCALENQSVRKQGMVFVHERRRAEKSRTEKRTEQGGQRPESAFQMRQRTQVHQLLVLSHLGGCLPNCYYRLLTPIHALPEQILISGGGYMYKSRKRTKDLVIIRAVHSWDSKIIPKLS